MSLRSAAEVISIVHDAPPMNRHVVEVLFADRCPSLLSAIERVRRAVGDLQLELDIEIRLVRVADLPSSPVVRVNGRVLLEPDAVAAALA